MVRKNDLFFVFYAFVSAFVILWGEFSFFPARHCYRNFAYGVTYFIVHDIFIHQRFKIWKRVNNRYAKAVRRAHKIHHKHLTKEDGECFGMLFVPKKFFKQ